MWIETEVKSIFTTKKGDTMVFFTATRDDGRNWAVPLWLAKKGLGDDVVAGTVVRIQVNGDRISSVQRHRHQVASAASARPNVESDTRRDVPKRSLSNTVLPYGFVPIDVDHAVTDEPVLHDGSSGGELLSGEILCELEALTPLLPGNARYAVEDADRQRLRQWGFGKLKDDKQIAEPLRLPDGRVVIAGTSLKGMIRQSLSALTSAPMERVGERHFTYRPNLKHAGANAKYECRPAIVTSVAENEIEVLVLPAQSAVFVHSQELLTDLNVFSHGAVVRKVITDAIIEVDERTQQKRIKWQKGRQVPLEHYLFSYSGGIDGCGVFAGAHANNANKKKDGAKSKVHREALVSVKDFDDGISKVISNHALAQYCVTQNVLISEEIGHISNSHPLIKHLKQHGLRGVKDSVEEAAKLRVNQLIYVEFSVDSGRLGEIVSFGHNYQYRWAYTSSISKEHDQPRVCLTPISEEQTPGKPECLTGARLLFGYVRDDKTTIGQGVFERLAGRIAINHAVSEGTPRFLGDPGTGFCIPLKILGQPKPSAWEFYLRQPDDTKEPLKTYGDLPDDPGGELAGRKFYRHQKGTHESDIKADTDEIISSDQATLARFISQPGTRFRFAIRFARLRPWELGALLAVLEPHRLAPEGKADDYAHKLGLGRPLGMGSVRISPSALRIRRENETAFLDDAALDITLDEAMRTLRAKLDDGVEKQWLDAHRMVPNQRLNYPVAKTKVDGNLVETIYAWHTDVRREYSQLRRQKSPDWSALAKKITREREADDPKSSST